MDKLKYLLKNIGFLALGSFSIKLFGFILIPLYTNVLSAYEYGIYDLVSMTVSLLTPIATANIADSTLRFALDKRNNEKDVFSVSIKYYVIGFFVVGTLAAFNYIFNIIPAIREFSIFLLLIYLVSALANIMSVFARGMECVKESSVSGALGAAATIILNIVFLVPLKLGLDGYFLASILGLSVQAAYLAVKLKLWNYVSKSSWKQGLDAEMINFSRPLIANNAAWWVNNSSDRYVVSYFCGIDANGIYSVGYKIPSLLNVLQTIVQQAWMLSAVKEYEREDKAGFFSRAYNAYNGMMVMVCALLIAVNKPLAHFLYAKEFYQAWKYVPYLSIGFVFMAMANFMGGIFQAVNATKIIAASTLAGAAVNAALDIAMTPFMGPAGAALATSISYFTVWAYRAAAVRPFICLKLDMARNLLVYAVLYLQAVFNIYYPVRYLNCVIIIGLCMIYKHEIAETARLAGKLLKK